MHEYSPDDEKLLTNSNFNYVDKIEDAVINTDLTRARELAHTLFDYLYSLNKEAMLDKYYQCVIILEHNLTKKIPFLKVQRPQKTIVEIEIFIYNLIDSSVKAIISDRENKYKRTFHQIKKEIDLNYSSQLTMDYYASLLNMNTKYFSKLFKDYNKVSFIDYLTKVRLNKAKELLEDGHGVKDSAQRVGYLDSAYFSKVFNQKFNISPSEYKQTHEK